MVFNATLKNISAISWRSLLLVEETGVSRENHRPVAHRILNFNYTQNGNIVTVNSIQFKALFRVDINHTYNTSSNELLKSTMVYNNTYNHAYKHIK
jgi:hypothetical protein